MQKACPRSFERVEDVQIGIYCRRQSMQHPSPQARKPRTCPTSKFHLDALPDVLCSKRAAKIHASFYSEFRFMLRLVEVLLVLSWGGVPV